MDKSVTEMTNKENTAEQQTLDFSEQAQGKEVRLEIAGRDANGKEITLEVSGKGEDIPRELLNPGYFMGCALPDALEALAVRMHNQNKLEGDKTPLNVTKWGLLSAMLELSPFFCEDSTEPDGEGIADLIKFASIFLPWRYENVAEIRAFKDQAEDRDEAERQLKQFFFDYYQENRKAPSVADFRRYFKRQAGIIPAPKNLGYLVHSAENEVVNNFFAFGYFQNGKAQEIPIRGTPGPGGKWLKTTSVKVTPYFVQEPPAWVNLVFFHAVEIGRLHRLDSDNKEDPFGPHYFTVESVVKALTGTKRQGQEIRELEIYGEVVEALNWLKENKHTLDVRDFIAKRCKNQNRQGQYVKDPILNWRIDPTARIDGSETEVYIFDRIPPMFWMTDELARLKRITAARFMPEGSGAPKRNGQFLALFDAVFGRVFQAAYAVTNAKKTEKEKARYSKLYLFDNRTTANRSGVFSAAGIPRPENCTPGEYKSNRGKLLAILKHFEKIGLISFSSINEGRKLVGYDFKIENERLIFGTTEEREDAQKVLNTTIPKKG